MLLYLLLDMKTPKKIWKIRWRMLTFCENVSHFCKIGLGENVSFSPYFQDPGYVWLYGFITEAQTQMQLNYLLSITEIYTCIYSKKPCFDKDVETHSSILVPLNHLQNWFFKNTLLNNSGSMRKLSKLSKRFFLLSNILHHIKINYYWELRNV